MFTLKSQFWPQKTSNLKTPPIRHGGSIFFLVVGCAEIFFPTSRILVWSASEFTILKHRISPCVQGAWLLHLALENQMKIIKLLLRCPHVLPKLITRWVSTALLSHLPFQTGKTSDLLNLKKKFAYSMTKQKFFLTQCINLLHCTALCTVTVYPARPQHCTDSPPCEDNISKTYTSRGGSEVGGILLNSTAHPPFTSKSTPPRCIFWTHRGCSTPRCPSSKTDHLRTNLIFF